MNIVSRIRNKTQRRFQPEHIEILNESYLHATPASESHFKIVIVSESFSGMNRIGRHRAINTALAEEIAQIHALALNAYTPLEWKRRRKNVTASPRCAGAKIDS